MHGRTYDPHTRAEPGLEVGEKLRRPGELAAQAVADPHRHRRRRLLVVHDDVEMGVKRGDLVDLGQSQPHLLGQCGQMARVKATEMVLQQVQMLDQQVAPALTVTQQRLNLDERCRIDLPALWMIGPAPASRARMDAAVVFWGRRHQRP